MKYYIDTNNEVYAYPLDGTQDNLILDKRLLSDLEVNSHLFIDSVQLEINDKALKYLNSTDWYITRFTELGVPIPQIILDNRKNARLNIIRELPNAS